MKIQVVSQSVYQRNVLFYFSRPILTDQPHNNSPDCLPGHWVNLASVHSLTSEQCMPVQKYPGLQIQMNDPSVFKHSELSGHAKFFPAGLG